MPPIALATNPTKNAPFTFTPLTTFTILRLAPKAISATIACIAHHLSREIKFLKK